MKTILLLSSLCLAVVSTPVVAAEFQPSASEDVVITLNGLPFRNRVTVGAARDSVLHELRAPQVVLHANVWVYTGFRAANIFGAEKYDSLVVTFKDEKVHTLVLAKESEVRIAATRLVPVNVAKR